MTTPEEFGKTQPNPARKGDGEFRRWLRRTAWAGLLSTLIMHLLFFFSLFYHSLSRMYVFEQIEFGMSAEEVQLILRKEGMWCGFIQSPKGSSLTIYFSDYWRSYTVDIDGKDGPVYGKAFHYHSPKWVPNWIAEVAGVETRAGTEY